MNKRNLKHNLILDALNEGLPPKIIASSLGVSYRTVIDIKNACFETFLKLKANLPDPNQLRLRL